MNTYKSNLRENHYANESHTYCLIGMRMYRHRVNTDDNHYADQIRPVPSQFKVGLRRPDVDRILKSRTYLYEFLKFTKLWD